MWWRNRQWRKDPSQQGEACLQNAQQCLEVPAILRKNQVEAVPELCTFHAVIRLRVLGMTAGVLTKLSVFHTKSLRRIPRVSWPNTISNEQLFVCCRQDSMDTIIIRRRWGWIGHVLRIDPSNITRTVLHWTPQGKRKRGRSKNTRRWAVERESWRP